MSNVAVISTLVFLVFTGSISLASSSAVPVEPHYPGEKPTPLQHDESDLSPSFDEEVVFLSRQRRFLLPSAEGWTLKGTVSLLVPIADIGAMVSVILPLSYDIDSMA